MEWWIIGALTVVVLVLAALYWKSVRESTQLTNCVLLILLDEKVHAAQSKSLADLVRAIDAKNAGELGAKVNLAITQLAERLSGTMLGAAALLTHRAPSGRTSAAGDLEPHVLLHTAANRIDVDAAQLPFVVGSPPVDAPITPPNHASVDPTRMPTPLWRRSSITFSGVKTLLIAGAIAAALVYIFAFESSRPGIDQALAPVTASIDMPITIAPPPQALPPMIEAQNIPARTGAEREVQVPSVQTKRRSESGPNDGKTGMTALQPTPDLESRRSESITTEDKSSAVPDMSPVSEAPLLGVQDIKFLIDRGRQFFKAGDVVAARLFFSRAANAGDATAAVEMGTTYDPASIRTLGVQGLTADLEKARSWYDGASKLGSSEGLRRLKMLEHADGGDK